MYSSRLSYLNTALWSVAASSLLLIVLSLLERTCALGKVWILETACLHLQRGANVRITHPFCLNLLVCIYIISYINIFNSWDPDLKVIKVGVSFGCRVCGSKAYALSQSCLKLLKHHGQSTCRVCRELYLHT